MTAVAPPAAPPLWADTIAVPRVRVEVGPGAGALGEAVRDAMGLLAAAGRIRWAEPGAPVHVLHTVGDPAGPRPPSAGVVVHSVDRVPLRGRELVASRVWVLRQRLLAGRRAAWLTHGRDANRLVVRAGLAPGERVHYLPVLAPSCAGPGQDRASVRRRLGLHPGVRLVVGTAGPTLTGWSAAVGSLHRGDLALLHLGDDPARLRVPGGVRLPDLLVAADLFFAAGDALTAVNPAVCALALGVPVVATTTDSAAGLVIPGRLGLVVAPDPRAVAGAVAAHLDRLPPLRGAPRSAEAGLGAAVELARALPPVYHDALALAQRPRRRRP